MKQEFGGNCFEGGVEGRGTRDERRGTGDEVSGGLFKCQNRLLMHYRNPGGE